MHNIFVKEIVGWYLHNKRDLPWRHTKDPYLIWLSEIILQQTRVVQGLPYYIKFCELYPTVKDFALAPIDEILRVWQGLGYYSRARNMHHTAQVVLEQFNGVFPVKYNELIGLKGVGKYTASAISSFASNEKHPVVDGNVYRVLARVWGISDAINSKLGIMKFEKLANELIREVERNDLYNQAIMEFGAMQCTPLNPSCKICPIAKICVAYCKGVVDCLPVKLKTLKVKERSFNYLVIYDDHGVFMKKRGDGDIWNGLYDFPLMEHSNGTELYRLFPKIYTHKLTHQRLEIRFFLKENGGFWDDNQEYGYHSWEQCDQLPKPIVINQFLKDWGKL